MRGKTLFLIALTIWLAGGRGHAQAWQDYRPPDASYRVEMPDKPSVGTRDIKSAPGQKTYYATVRYGPGALMVAYSPLARDRMATPADKTYDEMRDTELKSLKAKLLNERHENVGSLPARRVTYDPANGLIVTKRYVIVKDRIYQISVVGPPGYADTVVAKRFIDSFALTTH